VFFLVLREKSCVSVVKRRKAEAEGQMTAWNKCPGCGATPSVVGLLAVPIVVNSGRESTRDAEQAGTSGNSTNSVPVAGRL